jgi:hypothetical protein
MDLDTRLGFGKFYGSTLRRIYVGANYFTAEQESILLNEWTDSGFLDLFLTTSSDGALFPRLDFKQKNREFAAWQTQRVPMELLVEDRIKERCNGASSYIKWGINHVDSFFVNPNDLDELERMSFTVTQSIQFNKIQRTENGWDVDFELISEQECSSFSETIKKLNLDKYNHQ